MSEIHANMMRIAGKRAARNIFSSNGILLISASTIITQEHLEILAKHGVDIGSDDVETMESYHEENVYQKESIVEEAVEHVRGMFEQIRTTKQIPLAELRREVVPIIEEASSSQYLLGLFASLQAKDDYTFRHNVAVGAITGLLGTWLGLDRQERLQLTTAALLHDVGKMLIPQDILNKPDKLTQEEYSVMKQHTVVGYDILKNTVGISHRQALVALQHHERLDGSGYPFGLSSSRIDLFSRIVAVADVFHAMTSNRIYRNPSPFYEVLSQMEKDTFGVLDPYITRVFIEKIMNQLIGHSVMLTDGREGIILMVHTHDPTHPLVQTTNGFVDLSRDLAVHIEQVM